MGLLAEEEGASEVGWEDRCRAQLTPHSISDSTAALSSLKNASGPEDLGVVGGVEPGSPLSSRVAVVSPAEGGSVLPELENLELKTSKELLAVVEINRKRGNAFQLHSLCNSLVTTLTKCILLITYIGA